MKVQKYTEADLQGLSDRDHIRLNATGLVVSTDAYGQYHTIKEVLDNSIDEISILPDSHVDVYFFQDLKKKRYQTAIIDTGRGFPLGKVFQAVTELKFSGKFTTDAYKTSSGMFGYGLKVATNLSSKFRVITHRDGEVVSVNNPDDRSVPVQDRTKYPDNSSGTVVVLDVHDDLFTEIPEFTENGYERIIHFLQILSIFSPTTPADPTHQKYRFFLVPKPLDKAFWSTDTVSAATYIQDKYERTAVKVYDSLEASDTRGFLSKLWELDSDIFTWVDDRHFISPMSPTKDLVDPKNKSRGFVEMGYDIKLYLPKILRPGKCLSLVNNVVIRNQSSSHIVKMTELLKARLSPYLADKQVKKYFEDNYDLPIYYAMSILYQGAKFSGFTKDGFVSSKFEEAFTERITAQLDALPEEYWTKLIELIAKDIQDSYCKFYNKPMSTAKARSAELNIKIKWFGCGSSNPEDIELFIVEGSSAGHLKNARDPEIHAVLLAEGKPANVIIDEHSLAKSRALLNKSTVYQDLKTIIGITPEMTDVSGCKYGKIIISTDADSDGYHIAAAYVSALFVINPLLISSGKVYVANPPLYEVYVGSRRRGGRRLLLRDKYGLIGFRSDIYSKCLDIYHRSKGSNLPPVKVEDTDTSKLFTGLCVAITEIGEHVGEYAAQFAMSPEILERLAMVAYALNPNAPDLKAIERVLGTKVHYTPAYKTIRIESMPQDIVISLPTFREQLYDTILPLLQYYAWNRTELFVSTKETDKFKMQQLSFLQLYALFKQIDSGFTIKRHKGLGGMGKEELGDAFINESTRRLKRITSLGDIDVIYGLMGVDVGMRKQLMIASGMTVGKSGMGL